MVLNLGCTLEPILSEVWKYWYLCRNLGQLKQNSGKKPKQHTFYFIIFFFLKVLQVILICSQIENHCLGSSDYQQVWKPLLLHTYQNCFFPLIVLPWVNFMSSPLCYSFLNLFILFRKWKGKKILLLAISKEISIIKPQMSATLIWNSHWNSVI